MRAEIRALEEAIAATGHPQPEVLTRADGSGFRVEWGKFPPHGCDTRKEVIAFLDGMYLVATATRKTEPKP